MNILSIPVPGISRVNDSFYWQCIKWCTAYLQSFTEANLKVKLKKKISETFSLFITYKQMKTVTESC